MIPMIMNREMFYAASILITFLLGGIFGYIRGRRGRLPRLLFRVGSRPAQTSGVSSAVGGSAAPK